jgi:hypothetical protein
MYGITDPKYCGVRFIPGDRLEAIVRAAAQAGLQFTAHSGKGFDHSLVHPVLSGTEPSRGRPPCSSFNGTHQAAEIASQSTLLTSPFSVEAGKSSTHSFAHLWGARHPGRHARKAVRSSAAQGRSASPGKNR